MAVYKKVLFLLLFAILWVYAAPGDSALYESFTSTAYPLWPEGWRRFSLDLGVNNMWDRAAGGQSRTVPGHVNIVGNNFVRNDDWLITRMVVPSADSQNLRFWYRAGQAGTFESLEVWVSTTTSDPAGMLTRLDSFQVIGTTYLQRTVSLGAYIDIPIYVGIRYPKLNGQRVRIDDITGPRYPALDVALIALTSPSSNFLLESLFTPSAVVKNYGSTSPAANFSVACTIYNAAGMPVYQDFQSVAPLLPNTTTSVNFTATTFNVGEYLMAVRTLLSGDIQTINDRMVKSLSVFSTETEKFYDNGIPSLVLTPGNGNGYGVKFGTDSLPSSIWGAEVMLSPEVNPALPSYNLFQIQVVSDTGDTGFPGPTLWQSTYLFGVRGQWNYVPIPGVVITSDSFYIFWIQAEDNPNCVGLVKDTCTDTLYMLGTQWDLNTGVYTPKSIADRGNRMIRSIMAPGGYIDAELTQILAPVGTIDTFPIIPRVTVKNNGTGVVNIPVELTITKDSVVYCDTNVAISVSNNSSSTIGFPIFNIVGADSGNYTMQARTILYGDQNPANDLKNGSFRVRAGGAPPGISGEWKQMVNLTFGEKPVGKGGCLAFFPDSNWIYALKGNSKPAFGIYSITANTWTAGPDIPVGSDGKKKYPKAGGAMVRSGKYLYVAKGGNRLEWWRYGCPGADSLGWKQLQDVPAGGKRVKGGTVLAAIRLNDTDYIFMAKGSKTNEGYLFNIATSTWGAQLSGLPTFDKSTAGCGFNETLVYSITYDKSNKTNSIFLANLKTNTWAKTAEVPLIGSSGKKKKIKEGSALTTDGTKFYLFKGGNLKEFFDYAPGESVTIREDIPITTKKGVKGGASLTCATTDGFVYALPGNKLDEFWRYTPCIMTPTRVITSSNNEGALANQITTQDLKLSIIPNPASKKTVVSYLLTKPAEVDLKLYDVTGTLVKSYANANPTKQGIIKLDATTLATGVYILRFNSDQLNLTRKLVIQK